MIHIQGLTKTYKQVAALLDIDLRLEAGEAFGLLGTNGSGRTTLLNVLATLVRATAGRVEVAGFDVRRQPLAVRQRIGYAAESPTFYDGLRVHEYLDFIAASRRLPADRRAAASEAALAWTHLGRDGVIRTLSRGGRQQLALAAALLHEPPVLLLDEPTALLDPLSRRRFQAVLRERHQRGATILLASNAAEDLAALCQRVGILHGGRLVGVVDVAAGGIDPVAVLAAYSTPGTTADEAVGEA